MPTLREPPADPPRAGQPAPVGELLARVARERGLDFEPPPVGITDTLPELLRMVDELAERFGDEQERRWLAAALAALSHHVQAGTLIPVEDSLPAAPSVAGIAVAVVTSPRGVLIGCRRDGIPRWVFPGGAIEDGETPSETAVRECAEEAGLQVSARGEIGRRTHPATGRLIIYVACTRTGEAEPWAAAPDELVEVCWLGRDHIEERMPDLHDAVRKHIDLHGGVPSKG